ncbi:hypothetical protein HPB47_019685 [Ixodes persulcatus]|uniref:Uncharacterized protein n=1 Tax=Ixodes persulcatus TaxID=34615 RepID=A0AC60QKY2_IXOPE|nr:hypothetical protein HPB47_019685 [Ixodes persulcatus]
MRSRLPRHLRQKPRTLPSRITIDTSQLKTSQPAGNVNGSAETSNIPDEPSDSSMEDSDNEASWNVKAIKKRRHGSNSSEATIITQVSHNLTVIVKPMDPTKLITKLNPLVLKEKLDSLALDGIIQIRPNYRLNLLALDTRNLESTKAILQLKNIGPLQVHTYEPTPASSSVGVIRGVSVEIADDDLSASVRLKSPGTQARRLGKSEVVKLIFTTGTPPDHIYVGHTRYQVLPYLEKPRQCPKCNRFGHIASTCTKAQKCSRCGADHDASNDNNYPTLDTSTSQAATNSAAASSQQSGSSRGTEIIADGAASKDQQIINRRSEGIPVWTSKIDSGASGSLGSLRTAALSLHLGKKTSNVTVNSTLHFANTPTAYNVDSGDDDVSPFTLREVEDERGIWLVFSPDMPFPAHLLLD